MKQLNLVIPGLLGPFSDKLPVHIQQQLKQPEFNVINKYLSRAETLNTQVDQCQDDFHNDSQGDSYHETLVRLINPQCKHSLCQLSAEHDGIDISQGFYYRADPVHFKAESDHAILIGPDLVSPETEEVKQLISSFNEHFSEDKLSLYSTNECRWYLRSEKPLSLEFSALDFTLGRDIKHFMPQGEDELWWRKILNEAQMLFFQHEVNQLRENQGRLSINGLWLWDFSFDLNACNTSPPDKLFTNEALAIALGNQAGITVQSTDNIDEFESTAVLVLDQLYESVCYGDVDAWFESLKQFCNGEFKRSVNLLSSKKIDELNIYPCNGKLFKINRTNLLKFWKKIKPLYKYI